MILSIESSCDDSSIAITKIETLELIFHKKISQELDHSIYGGVVPELAARLHAEALPKILEECVLYFPKLKAIAVTTAPGLTVTLQEGVMMAKALSITLGIPLISINHLQGHIYSTFIGKEAQFPLSVLLVSGGHTQIIEVSSFGIMRIVGETIDDSFGESFDKVAKMLDLGYPGGPIVEQYALQGDPYGYDFPIPLRQSQRIEFSFSGLKNAVRMATMSITTDGSRLDEIHKANICASFQRVATEHITMKLKKYLGSKTKKDSKESAYLAIVGGASANRYLREKIEKIATEYGYEMVLAPMEFCSDNAAMIGRVAVEHHKIGDFTELSSLSVQSRIEK